MIKDLWDLAQGLIGLKDNFTKAKRDRKDRIAEYFSTIGTIIQDAADIFKKGEVPHGKCQQMYDHAKLFSKVVGDTKIFENIWGQSNIYLLSLPF